MEHGRGASALLWAVDRLPGIRRGRGLLVVPMTPCESGYRPRGEGWTPELREIIEQAHQEARRAAPDAVGWAIGALPFLSPADEASLTDASMSLGVPLLAARGAAAVRRRVWILTGTAGRGRIMRRAVGREWSGVRVIGPWDQRPTRGESDQDSTEPPSDLAGGILVVADSKAMAGSLDPVAARLRELSAYPILRLSAHQLPRSTGGGPVPKRLQPVGREPEGWPATKRLMARTALEAGKELLRRGEGMSGQVDAIKDWLRPRPPALIIVGNDRVGPAAALVCAARDLGIPTLSVQDGVAADVPSWWIRHAEWTASNGTQLRDVLVARGAPEDRIRITGQPRYGPLPGGASPLGVERRGGTAASHEGESIPVVLAVLQDKHDVDYVRELLHAVAIVADLRQVRVVVRPHPSTVLRLSACLPPHVMSSGLWVVDSRTSAMNALDHATVVVGQYSTMLVEAAARGIPVVRFHTSPAPLTLDLSVWGLAQSAGCTNDLVLRCVEAIDGRGAPDHAAEAAQALLGALDGRSADRVAAFALEILKG